MNRVQELMSMFVQLYRTVLPNKDIRRIINDLNSGLCYFISTEIGLVLKKEGYNVAYCGHAHHSWLNVEGVDYDTLYPEGYPRNVVEEWKLDQMGLSTNTTLHPVSDKPEKESHCHPFYGYQEIQRLWRNLHGLAQPEEVKKSYPINRYYKRRLDARIKKAAKLVYHLEPIPSGIIVPLTHYSWDSVIEDCTRPLVPYPFMRSVRSYKVLFKDLRLNGTPLQAM